MIKRLLIIFLCFNIAAAIAYGLTDLQARGFHAQQEGDQLHINLPFSKVFIRELPARINVHYYPQLNHFVLYLNSHPQSDIDIYAHYPMSWARQDYQGEKIAYYARIFADFLMDAGIDPDRIIHVQDKIREGLVMRPGRDPQPILDVVLYSNNLDMQVRSIQ